MLTAFDCFAFNSFQLFLKTGWQRHGRDNKVLTEIPFKDRETSVCKQGEMDEVWT